MTHAHRSATPVSTHDTTRIDDTRIKAVRPLITPALLQEWLPPTEAALALVESSRAAISRVLHGQDDRLVVVVGPCSIHDHAQAMEYAHALKVQADALQDDLLVVMRVYFEKPRTTVGWKGYINDPHLDGSFAINEGLQMARRLLLDVLALGLPAGKYGIVVKDASGTSYPVEVAGILQAVRLTAAGAVALQVEGLGDVSPASITRFVGQQA